MLCTCTLVFWQSLTCLCEIGPFPQAVLAFYEIGNAYLSARGKVTTDAHLLFFQGCYVGGAMSLQGANGVDFIARQAFAPSRVTADFLIEDAPYSSDALAAWDALLASGSSTHEPETAGDNTALLTEKEDACLLRIRERVARLEERGVKVAGMVVEYVSAGVQALHPRFLKALRRLLRSLQLLLLEDAVMVGLRTGVPFMGALVAPPDFVAIGKAYGFSGLLGQRALVGGQLGDMPVPWANNPRFLNGYLTMRMSAADLLRAVTILTAIHERDLVPRARVTGKRLRVLLGAQGLEVRGLGLLLAFEDDVADDAGQEPMILNSTVAFSRLLPPLSLGEHHEEWTYMSSLVVGSAGYGMPLLSCSIPEAPYFVLLLAIF